MSDLADLTATAAAEQIRDGTITSEALVSACLARVAERDPEIEAWAWLDPGYALEQARRADRWRGTGSGTGPLHGVPVGIKDIFDTADMPTESGSSYFAGQRPTQDAACVAALRNAGAIILGKTVTTELATLTPSKTKNPNNLAHTPGGSSSGSAASVASRMVPAALGSQTAGSVIRPASYCGVFGFKPTFGLISRRGVLMQSHMLDTVGILSRSLEDLALLTDCMSAHDSSDPASYPRSQSNLSDISGQPPPLPPLFALVKTPAWSEADEITRECFGELAEALGGQLEEVDLPSLQRVIDWQRIIQSAENATYYGAILSSAPNQLSAQLKERLEAGRTVPVGAYIEAVTSREGAYEVVAQLFDRYSAILTPAAPGPAPHGLASTGSPVFNGLWTYLGMPAVSLPLLESDGLPIGVQLVGARGDDGRLLRTARWLVDYLAEPAT